MRIFIACSASDRVSTKYKDLASEVSTALAKSGHKLVFGGADTGMMGKCYMTFRYEDSKVKAVVDIKDTDMLEVLDVDAYDVTTSTMQRVEKLYKSSHVTVVLPGGIGTMAEFFNIIDEVRTRKAKMPIILYNFDGFYNEIIKFMKKSFDGNFVTRDDMEKIKVVTNIDELMRIVNKYDKEMENE